MIADFAAQIAAGQVWVIVENDRMGGYVVYYRRGDHLHLENVAVHPDQQGRGYGKMLIDHAETAARQSGAVAVELYTNARMTENQSLYPALGYEEVGRGHEDGFDRVFYRKRV